MTLTANEEEARLVRGGESQSQYIPDSDVHRKPGSGIEATGSKQVGINRVNGTPGLQLTGGRTEDTGKIIRQLIVDHRNQVASKKNEIQDLEIKIQEFETLLEDIEAGIDTE